MTMYRKARDTQIIEFVEEYGGITANICKNLFFTNTDSGYRASSRRLKVLYVNKILRRFRKNVNDEYVYYRTGTPIRPHKAKLLEFMSILSTKGTIQKFEQEVKVPSAKRVNDGLIELVIEKADCYELYPLIVEVDYSHDTSLNKLNEIYSSRHYQKIYDIMPMIIIIKRYEHQLKYKTDLFNIIYLNWDLTDVDKIFE